MLILNYLNHLINYFKIKIILYQYFILNKKSKLAEKIFNFEF